MARTILQLYQTFIKSVLTIRRQTQFCFIFWSHSWSVTGHFLWTQNAFSLTCLSISRFVFELLFEPLLKQTSYIYHPRMRVGNVFGHVCVSVCLSLFLSVQAVTF